MEVIIGIVIVVAGILFFIYRSRTTRISYQRDIKPANEAKRVPVTDKCPCGRVKCPDKGKPHPPLNKQKDFHREGIKIRIERPKKKLPGR